MSVSVSSLLSTLPYDDVRVFLVLCPGVVSVKVCKGATCGLFRVSRAYAVRPDPACLYGVLCVLAFLDRRSICGSKCVFVLRELRRVNLYTVPDAVLSFRRVFIVFLFS